MILAVDLGTNCGYAFRVNDVLHAGTWTLKVPPARKNRNCCEVDPRLLEFERHLKETSFRYGTPDIVVYEDVQFMRYQYQAMLWSAFRTILVMWAHGKGIPVQCCPVKTLKKFATGDGKASKDDMIHALVTVEPNLPLSAKDDNAADAIHLLRWAEHKMSILR